MQVIKVSRLTHTLLILSTANLLIISPINNAITTEVKIGQIKEVNFDSAILKE